MEDLTHNLKVYLALVSITVRNVLVNRAVIIFQIVGLVSVYITFFFGVWAMLDRFGSIGPWSKETVIFIYTLGLISYGIRVLLSVGMANFDRTIRTGKYDITAIRPINTLLYQLGNSFSLNGISHILAGIILLCIFANSFGIQWTFAKAILLIFVMISSGFVQIALTIVIASLGFIILDTKGINNFYMSIREFTFYPVTLFNKFIIIVLFTVVPLAFATYVPAGVFIVENDFQRLPASVWLILSLTAGPFFLLIANKFWHYAQNFYQGAGN